MLAFVTPSSFAISVMDFFSARYIQTRRYCFAFKTAFNAASRFSRKAFSSAWASAFKSSEKIHPRQTEPLRLHPGNHPEPPDYR